MNFEILSVGTELLLGQIVNTNARDISRMLSELGMNVYYTTVVGDNPDRLKEALKTAAGRADGVILTGGLGPTGDDLTKETVAEYCGLSCVMHQESRRRLIERFQKMNRPMPENNWKQAEMPEGCIVLDNDNGTAPGAIVEHGGKVFIMLPGPPREMVPMLREKVRPYLEQKADCVIHSRTLRVFGVGESAAEEQLKAIIDRQENPTIAPYAKTGEMELRLTAKAESVEQAEELLMPLETEVREILGDFVYAEGETATLQQTVVELLHERKLTVATAESCTGGLVAKKLTDVSGASNCFHCGFVTYSNEKKEELLGVSHDTLEKFGAVSQETALEMSRGARLRSGADIGVSMTGIAGPGGGTPHKPVGLVYISISAKDFHKAYRLQLAGDREMVRERTSLYVLDMIRRYLLGNLDADYVW
ncbi:MAG: competence/damage-inducible protein A [Clostridia bacterium]|nr:competence/damage-inducible protein A [Clostridia bacterium]